MHTLNKTCITFLSTCTGTSMCSKCYSCQNKLFVIWGYIAHSSWEIGLNLGFYNPQSKCLQSVTLYNIGPQLSVAL